jgi:hypothetical protein
MTKTKMSETEDSNSESTSSQAISTDQSEDWNLPVDRTLDHYQMYRVYKDFACKLVRADLQKGLSKFYVLQLLEHVEQLGSYCVFSRWGTLR